MTDEANDLFTWNEEMARRIDELDFGKAKTIPWDEVQRRIATKLKNGQ